MPRAQVNANGRLSTWMPDEDFEKIPEEDKPEIIEQFPEYFTNPEIFDETVSFCIEDYRVENNLAVFDPLPESIEALAHNAALQYAPEHLSDTDDAICHLYEETLAQQEIMDEQDAAICALYEMIGA